MECKVYEFAKIDKKEKRCLRKAYYQKQRFDILISYIFILMSSSKVFFSFRNGALWVLVWYTCSLLLSCYTYVNQIEYNVGRKRARHYSKSIRIVYCKNQLDLVRKLEVGLCWEVNFYVFFL